jgi:hypothetical protein
MKIQLALVVCLCAVVAGCSRQSSTEAEPSAKPGKTQFLSIGTAPPGGAFFVVGGAISEVLNAHKETGNWNVTAEATMGTQENIRRLVKNEIDLGMANAAITYFAVRGKGEWKEPQAVKAVMTLAPNVAFFITPATSGIKTMADLKGKRVVIGPAGAGFEYFVGPILEAHGLTMQDITPLYATQTAAVDMLSDGSAAAAFLGGAIPTASITQACATGDIHFIPFDEAARKKLIAEYMFFQEATVPANTYKGQTEPFVCLNVGSMHLITSSQKDDDTVYQFTKALYENRAEVAAKHPAGKAINEKNAARNVGTEFHPGAIRYYKEIGVWKD